MTSVRFSMTGTETGLSRSDRTDSPRNNVHIQIDGRWLVWYIRIVSQVEKYGPVPTGKHRNVNAVFPQGTIGNRSESTETNPKNFRSEYCFHFCLFPVLSWRVLRDPLALIFDLRHECDTASMRIPIWIWPVFHWLSVLSVATSRFSVTLVSVPVSPTWVCRWTVYGNCSSFI